MTVISASISDTPNAAPGFSGGPSGGVQRVTVSHGGREQPAALPGRGSTATDYSSVQRVSSADVGEGNTVQAVSPTGRPLAPSEITADTLVTIQGQQMRAALAERLGFLAKDANGYRNTGAASSSALARVSSAPQGTQRGTQGGTQRAQVTSNADDDQTYAPALSGAASTSLAALNAGGQDTHGAAVEYLDTGELSPAATARLAGRLGIEPDAVQQHVANVAEGFRAQAVDLVGGAEVLDLAYHIDPAQAARVARDHALKGDVSGYAALAAKVTEHVVSNAAAVESVDADIRVRTHQGRHLVSGAGIPGEIDLRQAVRLGLVSVTVQR